MNSRDQEKNPLKWLLVILFLFWLALVLASYYLVQNAYLQPTLEYIRSIDEWLVPRLSVSSIGHSILDVLTAFWITFVALGVGRWILALITRSRLLRLEELLAGLGLGFGVLGLGVLVLGLLGLISRPFLLVLLAALTLVVGRSNIRFLRELKLPRPSRLIGIFILVSLALALAVALLPPTSWDGLFYHLTGPKIYIEQGQIAPGIDIPHLSFPSLFEMLTLLAMSVRGPIPAILLHFIFALMLLGLVYMMAKELLKVRNAWSAALFLLAIPMILSLAGWAYNDLALAFYEVIALYALLKWRAGRIRVEAPHYQSARDESTDEADTSQLENNRSWLILSAIMLGLAMGLKYTSVVALASLAGLLLWWYRMEMRRVVKPLLIFLGLAIVVASPWFIKNLAFTGNPIYPFVFGGENWDDFRAAAYGEGGTGIAYDPESCSEYSPEFLVGQHPTGCDLDIGHLVTRLLLLPYDITLGIRDASQDGFIGPLFLIFLPLVLLFGLFVKRPTRPTAMGGVLFFVLAQFLFWTVGVIASAALWQSRLLLPGLIALCPVISWVLEDLAHLDHPKFSLQRQLYLVIGLVLLAGLFFQAINLLPQQPWGYVLGGESEQENLKRRLGKHYEAMEAINTETPEDAVVAFLWEPRSYFCERDCRPDSILDEFGHLQYQFRDAASIVNSMRDEGITHVLIFEKGLDFVLEANSPTDDPLNEPQLLIDLRANYLEPVAETGDEWYTLYAIKVS